MATPNDHSPRIVAYGEQRLREAAKPRIMAEVRLRHRAESERASWCQRLWLEFRIQREVAARLEKEFSSATLYIATLR